RCYASRIPDAVLAVWNDVGHLGIVAKWAEVLGATS
ncbi:MAG: hypothetical protein QOF28_1097, partial [Actinomycetota bacterium]|nr:hypothetical protein [Actinomycetota bacterium]